MDDQLLEGRNVRSLTLLCRFVIAVIVGFPLAILFVVTGGGFWMWPGERLGDLIDWIGKDET